MDENVTILGMAFRRALWELNGREPRLLTLTWPRKDLEWLENAEAGGWPVLAYVPWAEGDWDGRPCLLFGHPALLKVDPRDPRPVFTDGAGGRVLRPVKGLDLTRDEGDHDLY